MPSLRQVILMVGLNLSITGWAKEIKECTYRIPIDQVTLKWTGYKFTTKEPVSGTFDVIDFEQNEKSDDVDSLFKSVRFRVETASINSNLPLRDKKLALFLFGAMKNPGHIKGKVVAFDLKKLTGSAELELNGVTKTIPFQMRIEDRNHLILSGSADLLDFNMSQSVTQISQECQALHTGPDGKSKTWSTVGIEIRVAYVLDCHKSKEEPVPDEKAKHH